MRIPIHLYDIMRGDCQAVRNTYNAVLPCFPKAPVVHREVRNDVLIEYSSRSSIQFYDYRPHWTINPRPTPTSLSKRERDISKLVTVQQQLHHEVLLAVGWLGVGMKYRQVLTNDPPGL